METNLVLQERILVLTFNFERSSVIYLSQPLNQGENPANELIELDLHNQTVLEKYVVSNQLPNQPPFTLITSKRKGLLIFSFSPSLMEIWNLSGSSSGINQSIWSGETKGKRGYEIQCADVSNLDGTLFFSAVGQRNIYCANIDDTIASGGPQLNISKLKIPLKVNVNDLKCHPCEYKMIAACSDGQVRIWNQNTFTELIGLMDTHIFTSISFQQDGQKLLTGTEDGRVLCWDAKTLGNRNILLAAYQIQESISVLCLHWLSYNGAQNTDDFLVYGLDGNIRVMNLKLLVPQQMIRDQKLSKHKKQELFGNIKEIKILVQQKNDLKITNYRNYNIGLNRFIQVHPYANFISINSTILEQSKDYSQTMSQGFFFQFNSQILHLNIKSHSLQEYPVCSQQYQYSFKNLIPDDKAKILTHRYLYYIDQHTLEIKQYCLAKGNLRTIANLKNLIFAEDAIYHQLCVRPNKLEFTQKAQFLFSYRFQASYRSATVVFEPDSEVLSDNVKEYPSVFSQFLGLEEWNNPPLFLLYEDRQSYSLLFEEQLPQDQAILELLTQQDQDKLAASRKQSLNVKVDRMFWTPIRSGFVVLYQSMNEKVLRFSRNRIQDNLITDLMMQSGSDMIFRLGIDEQITDVVWQKNDKFCVGAIVCTINVYVVNENLAIQKVISLLPQINRNNRALYTFWFAHTLIIQTKFHILYILLNGKQQAIQSLDTFEEKNILLGMVWDRVIILSQNFNKRGNVEIKTKSVNLIQPVIQGYLWNQKLMAEIINYDIVEKLIITFANQNIDFSIVQDLEEFNLRSSSKYIVQLDDCKQFTQTQKARYYMNTLDNQNLMDVLFGHQGLQSLDLQLMLIKQINDPRYQAFKLLLQTVQQYFLLSYSLKNAGIINGITQKSQNLIINLIASQNKLDAINVDQTNKMSTRQQKLMQILLKKQLKQQQEKYLTDNEFNLNLTQVINDSPGNHFVENLGYFLESLKSQQQQIQQSIDKQQIEMQPSYYVTDYLLEKLKLLKSQPIQKLNVNFGEEKYHLVYEDQPNEEDDDENIINGRIIRYFDQISYESIIYFLGVGGQPQAKQFQQKKQDDAPQEEYDFGEDDDTKEFKDLLIYWRIDEGKGGVIEDLGNNEANGEIYVKGEQTNETEDLWEKLKESEPMEYEDKWGKRCEPQFGLALGANCGIQTKKKNYWKRKQVECFTIEFWIFPNDNNGQILQVGDNQELLIYLDDSQLKVKLGKQQIQFTSDKQNDENQQSKPTVEQKWTHICLSYESNVLQIYLDARYSFQSQEIEMQQDLFKNHLTLGCVQQNTKFLQFQITEFRFWKQKFSINEIKDSFRTPLSIVSEKRKKLTMKLQKDKKDQNKGDLKQLFGALQMEEIQERDDGAQIPEPYSDPFAPEPIIQETKPLEFTNEFQSLGSQFQDFGSSLPQNSTNQFGGFGTFEGFGQPEAVQPVAQQQAFGNWGSEFQNVEIPKPNKEPQQYQQKNPQIQEIQKTVDDAMDFFSKNQIQQGVSNLTNALDKLKEFIGGHQDKLKKIQKFIVHCACYRFAFQLLVGIKQMQEQNNKKKEIYLILILIHLNLKSNHRINLIIKCIQKCIDFQNTLLAELLCQQLQPSMDKIGQNELQLLKECQKRLSQVQEKQNACLMRLTCPTCQKHFHFKGIKKCSKCQKDFLLCQQTLSCQAKDKILQCKACESCFSTSVKQKNELT
ncbi:hypothetical protein pb186bvf_003010 [Paramecium bursaria]